MSVLETFKSDNYPDGRTKQSFKDQTDINQILAKASKGQTISHLAKHGAVYGDFSDIDDLLTAHARLKTGQAIFDKLPGEVKQEFNNDLGAFYNFVNDPENRERLPDVLPNLAKRGRQLPKVTRTAANQTAPAPQSPPPNPNPQG